MLSVILRVGEQIPELHYVAEVLDIPAVDPKEVHESYTEQLDVTCIGDTFRRFIAGPTYIYDKHGNQLIVGHPSIIQAALSGGGRFYQLQPNPVYSAQTLDEYIKEELEEAAAEAMDLAYDW